VGTTAGKKTTKLHVIYTALLAGYTLYSYRHITPECKTGLLINLFPASTYLGIWMLSRLASDQIYSTPFKTLGSVTSVTDECAKYCEQVEWDSFQSVQLYTRVKNMSVGARSIIH
jgi:hypothetical protein